MQLTSAALFMAFAATTVGFGFLPLQSRCIDITKPMNVQWTSVNTDPTNVSFVFYNKDGAYPNIDEVIPVGGSPPLVVSTSKKVATLPAISADLAKQYSNNSATGYTINAVNVGQKTGDGPLDQTKPKFTIANPDNGKC